MQSPETKSSGLRPKSFETETETRPEPFETETSKTGLEMRLEAETKSRDSITGKPRRALCRVGLVKDLGGHLVNQPRLSLFDNC